MLNKRDEQKEASQELAKHTMAILTHIMDHCQHWCMGPCGNAGGIAFCATLFPVEYRHAKHMNGGINT